MRLLRAARLSRSHDAATGLDKQDEQTARYADALEHEIIATAADSDVSGKTDPFARPELGPWLTDPKLIAQYDGIIAASLDRFARSTRYMSRLLDWADEHGKVIICVNPAVDFSTPVGKLIAFIMSWLAQEELALITKRSIDTQTLLKAKGYLVGRVPFGFAVVESGDHKTIVPDPAQAAVIREVVERLLGGASLREIAAWLDDRGVKPISKNGKSWSPASLAQVLRNETLAGRRKDETGRTILRTEPILDPETWRKLQAELDRKANRKGVVRSETAMLTGVAVCGKCGGPMYRIRSTTTRKDGSKNVMEYYRCHGNERSPSKCRLMVPVAKLNHFTESWLYVQAGHKRMVEIVAGTVRDHSAEIDEAKREMADAVLAEDFSRLPQLQAEVERLRNLPTTTVSEPEERETGVTVWEHWQTLDGAGKRAYLLASGTQVIVKDKGTYFVTNDAPYKIHRAA